MISEKYSSWDYLFYMLNCTVSLTTDKLGRKKKMEWLQKKKKKQKAGELQWESYTEGKAADLKEINIYKAMECS